MAQRMTRVAANKIRSYATEETFKNEKLQAIRAMHQLWAHKPLSERKEMDQRMQACETSNQLQVLTKEVRDGI